MNAPKTVMIKRTNFPTGWALAVFLTVRHGAILPASSDEHAQLTRDIYLTTEYGAEAVQEMLDVGFHALYPQKRGWEVYRKQFFPETKECEQARQFDYTYYQRLFEYPICDCETLDQIKYIAKFLRKYDRTLQAITWDPQMDLGSSKTTPCLQRIHIRQLDDETYQVWMDWRSRDLFKAYQMNLIGLLYVIDYYINKNREKPLQCVGLVDKCDTAHVYEEDWDRAMCVTVEAKTVAECALY